MGGGAVYSSFDPVLLIVVDETCFFKLLRQRVCQHGASAWPNSMTDNANLASSLADDADLASSLSTSMCRLHIDPQVSSQIFESQELVGLPCFLVARRRRAGRAPNRGMAEAAAAVPRDPAHLRFDRQASTGSVRADR